MIDFEGDNSRVFLTDFSEVGTVSPQSGASSFSIKFIRSQASELMAVEPGYADFATFETSVEEYPAPHIGDIVTDSKNVAWIVEPGINLDFGWLKIPVKSDRRVRS